MKRKGKGAQRMPDGRDETGSREIQRACAYAEIQSNRRNKRNNSAYEHANFAPCNFVGSVWHELPYLPPVQSYLNSRISASPVSGRFSLVLLFPFTIPTILRGTPPTLFAILLLMANDYCQLGRSQVSGWRRSTSYRNNDVLFS